MAYKIKDKERARQAAKRGRSKENLRRALQDASLTPEEKDLGRRIADEFMREHAKVVQDLEDLKKSVCVEACKTKSRWEGEHGVLVADYAYRQVSLGRAEELYRQHYAATRKWYQSRNPPPGRLVERMVVSAFVLVLFMLFVIEIASKMSR